MTYLRTGLSTTATLTLTVATLAAPAFSQELPARNGVLSFSQGFELTDNPDLITNPTGDSLISRTAVGLTLNSETRAQRLSFSIGTEIVGDLFGEATNDDFESVNTRASVEYFREGANSNLTFSASYQDINLGDEVFDTGTEFIIDSGSLETTSIGASLRFGLEGPFGFDLDASHTDRDYTDTIDPDLIDETVTSLDATAHFRVAPNYGFRVVAGRTETDESGGPDTTDSYVGAGIEGELASGLSYVGDVLFDRSETNGSVTDDGVGLVLGVSQAVADGEFTFDVASRIDETGRRTQVEAGRNFDLPDGSLGFSLGVVDQEGDSDLHLIGSIDYTKEIPNGVLSASLTQTAATGSGGDAQLNTGVSVAFNSEINAVSSWQAAISYFATEDLGGADDDSRARASLSYQRDLTEDWGMRTGIEYENVSDAGSPDRSSNTLFFNIERDFTFGF